MPNPTPSPSPSPSPSHDLGKFLKQYEQDQKPPVMVSNRPHMLVGDGVPLVAHLGFSTDDEWNTSPTLKGQTHDDHD